MSDVSHAKFISSYHSNGEETEVPDLYYRYNEQFVNVYSRMEENNLISTVTTDDLGNIAGEQHLVIQNVLEATFRKKPILVIVTKTSKSMDDFIKPRIYVFWHRILENDTKMVFFDLPMVGDISVIAMTSQPFALIHGSAKQMQKQEHVRHLLAFGKRDQSLHVALLHDAGSPGNRVRGQVINVELPSERTGGDITTLHILTQCTRDLRLGYGDPRVFVGLSDGYIHVLRFKALFKEQALNGLHVEPGYTWGEMVAHGKHPITYLACKRALGINKVIVAVGQEQTDNSLYNGDDDDDDDSAHYDDDDNDNKKKINDNASLWVIEWYGNYHRRTLDLLAPTKLSSFTLASTRIIPALENYQVTAIFQSTQDKGHFEIDVWTIEKGAARLVLSDEIFKYDITSAPQDVWPIHLTSRYMLLAHESDPTEVDISNTNITASPETNEQDELSNEHDLAQPLNDKETDDTNNNGTTDLTSTHAQDDDEQHNTSTTKLSSDSTMTTDDEIESSSSILDSPSEHDEKETVTDVEDLMRAIDNDDNSNMDTPAPLAQDDHEERTQRTSVDTNDDLLDQSVDDGDDEYDDANDGLDFDDSSHDQEEHQWQNGDASVRLGDGMDNDYNKSDMPDANGMKISNDNNDTMNTSDSGTGNNSHDDHTTVTTHGSSNKITTDNGTHSIVTDDDDTSITDNEILVFDDDINNNALAGSSGATSVANESFSPEQSFQHTLSSEVTPTISRNEEGLSDNTNKHICKLEPNATGLESNNMHFGATSETTPLLAAEFSDVKSPSSPPIICLVNKEKEPPTPKTIYKTKIRKVVEASVSDGLDMVRQDETAELNRRERLWALFDIIFSMTTTATSATTKTLDIDKAMETLETLSLDAMEQDWLMCYCFTHENQLLKLFIMRYNIKHENFGLVMMQYETMKAIESNSSRQEHHSQSTQPGGGEDPSEKATGDIGRTCNNLTKLCRDMVPLVLQDLPLEIFGQARGKVGNPFLDEEIPSLLQEKGLGLGGELLAQVMESRKRRRLD